MSIPRHAPLLTLALLVGATLVNLVEEHIRSDDDTGRKSSHASLKRASLESTQDGKMLYRIESNRMTIRDDGMVFMDTIAGRLLLEDNQASFGAEKGRTDTASGVLSLEGSVSMDMDREFKAKISGKKASMMLDGSGIEISDQVKTDMDGRKISASSLRWQPNTPLQFEDVRVVVE